MPESDKQILRFQPKSYDIAHSYSMQKIIHEYLKTGKNPNGWYFTGPKTATGNLGKVEWFLGTYDIENFHLENGEAKFTVKNVSSWHSGTRLPKSWQDYIKIKPDWKY